MIYEEFVLLGEAVKQTAEQELAGGETMIPDVRAINRTLRNRERLLRGSHNQAARSDQRPVPDSRA